MSLLSCRARAYALAALSEYFYEQHEEYSEIYDQIWATEQQLADEAEERKTEGVWGVITGAALIAAGAACIFFTAGTATPIVVAGAVAGGGTFLFGAADAVEGGYDIYYGSMGDVDSASINYLKSVVFQGNETAYQITESVFAFTASALVPIGAASKSATLTFRSGAVAVGKLAISDAAGSLTSKVILESTGNRAASMLAGMAASTVTGFGLNALDSKYSISAGKVSEENSAVASADNEYHTSTYSDFADAMSSEDRARYIAASEEKFFSEYVERAEKAGLSDAQIIQSYEAMRSGNYKEMASYLDTSSPEDGAVFWSKNKEAAASYAKSIDGTTLEQTPGGRMFDDWRGLDAMYPDWGSNTILDQEPIWKALSTQYANDTKGTATYVHPEGTVGDMWSKVEKPILKQNGIGYEEVIVNAK